MDKKNGLTAWLIVVLLGLIVVTSLGYYLFGKSTILRYNTFGIDIPTNYFIHGIDVSHHQSDIDWGEVRAMEIQHITIGFCFIKATEGVDRIDDRFADNWEEAKEHKLTRGAYHFFNPEKSGTEQANNFIKNVQLSTGDLPPVLDVEQLKAVTIKDLQQRVSDWLTIAESYYKVKPIIYTGADFYKKNLAGKFDDYPLWVAHYQVKDKPGVKRNWLFWQHNDAGHVNGIDAYVDFNVFNGDTASFKELLVK